MYQGDGLLMSSPLEETSKNKYSALNRMLDEFPDWIFQMALLASHENQTAVGYFRQKRSLSD